MTSANYTHECGNIHSYNRKITGDSKNVLKQNHMQKE